MSATRFVGAGLLATVALFATSGCGSSTQQTGTQVTETQETKDSRAAMQKAMQENPNLYSSKKAASSSRSGR